MTIALGVAGLLLAMPLAGFAVAADRTLAQRETLAALAYVMGESHALRQLCEAPGDQQWRRWMARLLQTEAPDAVFDRRLRDNFNTGYYATQARFPICDAAARAESQEAAAQGRSLTRQLDGG